MKKETELTFKQKLRMGYGAVSSGPFRVVTLKEFLRNIKIEQTNPRDPVVKSNRNEGYHPALDNSPVQDAIFSRRVITMDRVKTSMAEHLERWFISECTHEGCKYSNDKELEALIDLKAMIHLEAFGKPELLVKLPTGQYLFADREDWFIVWNTDPLDLLERNAAVICLHKNRSNQLFLPYSD